MAGFGDELNHFFAIPPVIELPPDILGELQSILRLHSISPQELRYKWESYTMKMGTEQTSLDLVTARAFKTDIQETLEREARGKAHVRSVDKRGSYATPRNAAKGRDVFGMIDGLVPATPQPGPTKGASKRKAAFETPSTSKINRSNRMSSPNDGRTDINDVSNMAFANRPNAGEIVHTLNDHLDEFEPPLAPSSNPRVKLTANTDLKRFYYKPMAMHLLEASGVLDDRIDEFKALVQTHHQLEDAAFGDATGQGTSEIIAVGRIVSDALEGKINAASLMLETSRRTGNGRRVPLNIESISYEFFPGQIVAVRGINASGEYFSVNEILEIPLPPASASLPSALDAWNKQLGVEEGQDTASSSLALNVLFASGPYTTDDNLAFEPLHALCDKAETTYADVLFLIGPFLDLEHPLVASGNFELPDDPSIEPDKATLTDAFRLMVGAALARLARAVPSITIILVPSARDAVNKHVAWPQEPFTKRELGLPKQARVVSNPIALSLNEITVGVTAQDILFDLRREEAVVGRPKESDILARLPSHLIQQRHFSPIFPPVDRAVLPKTGTQEGIATGMPLDVSYFQLGELNVRHDILVTPSALPSFAKVCTSSNTLLTLTDWN